MSRLPLGTAVARYDIDDIMAAKARGEDYRAMEKKNIIPLREYLAEFARARDEYEDVGIKKKRDLNADSNEEQLRSLLENDEFDEFQRSKPTGGITNIVESSRADIQERLLPEDKLLSEIQPLTDPGLGDRLLLSMGWRRGLRVCVPRDVAAPKHIMKGLRIMREREFIQKNKATSAVEESPEERLVIDVDKVELGTVDVEGRMRQFAHEDFMARLRESIDKRAAALESDLEKLLVARPPGWGVGFTPRETGDGKRRAEFAKRALDLGVGRTRGVSMQLHDVLYNEDEEGGLDNQDHTRGLEGVTKMIKKTVVELDSDSDFEIGFDGNRRRRMRHALQDHVSRDERKMITGSLWDNQVNLPQPDTSKRPSNSLAVRDHAVSSNRIGLGLLANVVNKEAYLTATQAPEFVRASRQETASSVSGLEGLKKHLPPPAPRWFRGVHEQTAAERDFDASDLKKEIEKFKDEKRKSYFKPLLSSANSYMAKITDLRGGNKLNNMLSSVHDGHAEKKPLETLARGAEDARAKALRLLGPSPFVPSSANPDATLRDGGLLSIVQPSPSPPSPLLPLPVNIHDLPVCHWLSRFSSVDSVIEVLATDFMPCVDFVHVDSNLLVQKMITQLPTGVALGDYETAMKPQEVRVRRSEAHECERVWVRVDRQVRFEAFVASQSGRLPSHAYVAVARKHFIYKEYKKTKENQTLKTCGDAFKTLIPLFDELEFEKQENIGRKIRIEQSEFQNLASKLAKKTTTITRDDGNLMQQHPWAFIPLPLTDRLLSLPSGPARRTFARWTPAPELASRFGVAPVLKPVGVPPAGTQHVEGENEGRVETLTSDRESLEPVAPTRPPMSLFKAVFDSDYEDDDE